MKGRLAYYGPPGELKSYFDISAIREVYSKETEKTVDEWETAFQSSSAYGQYVAKRATPTEQFEATHIQPGQTTKVVRHSSPKRQLRVLMRRYLQVILTDWRNLLLTLALAPLVGLLVSIVLSGGDNESSLALASLQGQLCFTLTLIVIFLGIFGSIREIIKELPIYRHERFVNLEIMPYLGSKVLPLAVIGAFQALELLLVVHWGTDLQVNTPKDIVSQFILLWCTTVAAMLLGLAISAAVDSADKAVMLMILVIIPQLLFSNAFIELKGFGKLLGQLFILAYWCHDGIKSLLPSSLLEEKNPTLESYENFMRQKITEESKTDVEKALGYFLGDFASRFVASQTIRKDYIFLSIYDTDLSGEHLRTLGILNNFIILQTPQSFKARI